MLSRVFNAAMSAMGAALLITACGGGGPVVNPPPPLATPRLLVSAEAIKALTLRWDAVAGATHYRLLEDADGETGPSADEVLAVVPASHLQHTVDVFLPSRLQAVYRIQACNDAGCTESEGVGVGTLDPAIGYFKASNTAAFDEFGQGVALSADGRTLAVSAYLESGVGSGVDPSNDRTGGSQVGAVYVFTKAASGWVQQAYLKPFDADNNDEFGYSLALSADGNRLVVGASGDDSAINGFQGVASDNSLPDSGIAYTFDRDGAGQWRTGQRLKGWFGRVGDQAGYAVALSADGRTLALGAHAEDNEVGGIDPVPTHGGGADFSGAVYVFTHDGTQWQPQAYLKAEIPGYNDLFGSAVALAANGDTLLVGAPREAGGLPGVNGPQSDNSAPDAGAAYVFARDGAGQWRQQAYVKPAVVNAGDGFGRKLQLSADGRTAVVAADSEDGGSTGVAGDPLVPGVNNAGAVHVFALGDSGWAQTDYLKPPRVMNGQMFGLSLALSGDGRQLAVGAIDHSSATGINGALDIGGANQSGAAFLFSRGSSGAWIGSGYLKAPHTHADAYMGWGSMSYSGNGEALAIGMSGDHSAATGVQGDQTDRSARWAGAVLLY